MTAIGSQIHRLREHLGMTQAQLARRAGTTQQAIALIEADKVDPRLSTLQKIAAALECELGATFSFKKPAAMLIHEKALEKARLWVGLTAGSSALELQAPSKKVKEYEIKETVRFLEEEGRRHLWK